MTDDDPIELTIAWSGEDLLRSDVKRIVDRQVYELSHRFQAFTAEDLEAIRDALGQCVLAGLTFAEVEIAAQLTEQYATRGQPVDLRVERE